MRFIICLGLLMRTLHIDLPVGSGYGWGTCGTNLTAKLKERFRDHLANPDSREADVCLSAISGPQWGCAGNKRGRTMVGYGFIEQSAVALSYSWERDRNWDKIVHGSYWMKESVGWSKDEVIWQGADPELFFHDPGVSPDPDWFTVGIWGKLEWRKGQDVAIKALSLFAQTHKNVRVIHAIHNPWPELIEHMVTVSRNEINVLCFEMPWFDPYKREDWDLYVTSMFKSAGDRGNIMHRAVSGNLAPHYQQCDVSLFTARAEAGQSLNLNESLACGVPAIVVHEHGYGDLTSEYEYPCKDLLLNNSTEKYRKGFGEYFEPCIDEIVSKLHYAYVKKEELRSRREQVAAFGRCYTWDLAADKFATILNPLLK